MDVSRYILVSRYIYIEISIKGQGKYFFILVVVDEEEMVS
jgi:hypothetical protein